MPALSQQQFGEFPSWGEGPALPTNAMASTQGGTRGRVTAQHVGHKLVNWHVGRGDVRVKKVSELKLEE